MSVPVIPVWMADLVLITWMDTVVAAWLATLESIVRQVHEWFQSWEFHISKNRPTSSTGLFLKKWVGHFLRENPWGRGWKPTWPIAKCHVEHCRSHLDLCATLRVPRWRCVFFAKSACHHQQDQHCHPRPLSMILVQLNHPVEYNVSTDYQFPTIV